MPKFGVDHVPDPLEILPKEGAVFNNEGHIKPSFLEKAALKSLKDDIESIKQKWSRQRVSDEDIKKIEMIEKRIGEMDDRGDINHNQNIVLRTHCMACRECRNRLSELRGDLPEGGLPFE